MSTRPAFYSALHGAAMQQHPAMMEACRSAIEPGAIAGTLPSGLLLQRGRPRSCQRGRNGLADRVTSAESVRERPSREPGGALAYGSDDHILIVSNQDLVGPPLIRHGCARESMTRLRASIPLRNCGGTASVPARRGAHRPDPARPDPHPGPVSGLRRAVRRRRRGTRPARLSG
jgi:hypothetical protein